MLITFLIAALASVALASGVPHSAPCDCKAECESLGGWRYCYVEGGASCELAWRSWIHPGEAYVPCPAAEPTNDGISRPKRSLLQFNDDDNEKEKKQNCKGDFGDFGECQMKAGKMQKCRVFKIETPAAGGGKECKKNDGEEDCESKGCEVDCEGDFGDFGECQMKAGKMQKCRVFKIETPAAGGGKECKKNDGEEECESKGCDDDEGEESIAKANVIANVDCEGDFGDFGECKMRDGKMQKCRVFKIETPAAGGGKECKKNDGEEDCETCDVDEDANLSVAAKVDNQEMDEVKEEKVDCEGDWGPFGECQEDPSGEGKPKRCRIYRIKKDASGGGKECKRKDGEKDCEDKCKKIDCEGDFGEYGPWMVDPTSEKGIKRCRYFETFQKALSGGKECKRSEGEEDCSSKGYKKVSGIDCVGRFSPSACVPARSPAFPGEMERCTEYKIESPAYKDGAPCPYEDGYLSCSESQYCLCNKPVYDEVEETECKRLSFTERNVNIGPIVISDGQISQPGITKCRVDVLARVTKWGENTANIRSISTSNARQTIDRFTASRTAMPGVETISGSYEKGRSEQSSTSIEYEGFKWIVSPKNCEAEVSECHGCKKERWNGTCARKGRVSGSGRCDFRFTTLGEVCVDMKKRVCVDNCRCDVESNSGATPRGGVDARNPINGRPSLGELLG